MGKMFSFSFFQIYVNLQIAMISVENIIFKFTLSKEIFWKPPFLGEKMMVLLDPISKLIKRKICVTAH